MTERKKLLLRLDPDVYQALARWAGDELRSVNAQIEYALRLALRAAGRAARDAGTADGTGPGGGTVDSGDPGGAATPGPGPMD